MTTQAKQRVRLAHGLPFGPLLVRLEGVARSVVEDFFHTAPPAPPLAELVIRLGDLPSVRPDWWLGEHLFIAGHSLCVTRESWAASTVDAVCLREGEEYLLDIDARRADRARMVEVFTQYVEPLGQALLAQRGATFLHASAVATDEGARVLPAWGQTGKTTLMLYLLNQGARFLGDDLVIVDEEGVVHPYPKGLMLFGYNVKEYPDLDAPRLLESFRRLDKRDRLLARFSRQMIPDRTSAFFRIDELVPKATVGEPARASLVQSLLKSELDWETRAPLDPERLVRRHVAVLEYEFRDSRRWLDAWRIIDPGVPALRAPEEPVRAMLKGVKCEAVYLPEDALLDEKVTAISPEGPQGAPPRPDALEIRQASRSGGAVRWHDFHGLFKFVIRDGKRAEELARYFQAFQTEKTGADIQFAIRNSEIVSRRGAVLLEGKYAVLPEAMIESEGDNLNEWQPGLVRSVRMDSKKGTVLIEARPSLEARVRSRWFLTRRIRRELSAEELLYNVVEPALQMELLKRNHTFIHAAGVALGEEGILLCSWRQVGKTALLLAFTDIKAGILGDDYVVLGTNGRVLGYPGRMNLYNVHFEGRSHLVRRSQNLPKEGGITRGTVADFFEDRIKLSANLRAVACLVRGEELSVEERDTAFAGRFNQVLLDEEFLLMRAAKMAEAYGRAQEFRPLHEAERIASYMTGAKVLLVRVPEEADMAKVRDEIIRCAEV